MEKKKNFKISNVLASANLASLADQLGDVGFVEAESSYIY